MMDQSEFALADREFERIRARLYDVAGISLSDAKRTLVIARLSRILRTMRLPSFDAYMNFLEREGTAQDAQDFVNALTTNLTRFWREEHHFTHLESYVGELMKSRPSKRLRIWSAGCSTGQEPYTIALGLMAAYPELKRWDLKILATDIDTSVIAKAATGVYAQSELNGLSRERAALFEHISDGRVRIPPAISSLVSFRPLNLMAPWPMKGPFDAIFCRNVAIYFDKTTQGEVFGRLGGILAPGGFLYIGHSENLGSGGSAFRLVGKTIYQSRAERAKDAA